MKPSITVSQVAIHTCFHILSIITFKHFSANSRYVEQMCQLHILKNIKRTDKHTGQHESIYHMKIR